jgi:hypothetical protein
MEGCLATATALAIPYAHTEVRQLVQQFAKLDALIFRRACVAGLREVLHVLHKLVDPPEDELGLLH